MFSKYFFIKKYFKNLVYKSFEQLQYVLTKAVFVEDIVGYFASNHFVIINRLLTQNTFILHLERKIFFGNTL